MNTKLLSWLSVFTVILLTACTGGAGKTPDVRSPQGAIQAAFEEWAKEQGVPYKDARFEELTNDGAYATVRVTAHFKPNASGEWVEMQAEIEAKRMGQEWQASRQIEFRFSEAELKKAGATSTAAAAARQAEETAVAATLEPEQRRLWSGIVQVVEVHFDRSSCKAGLDAYGQGIVRWSFLLRVRNDDDRPHRITVRGVAEFPDPWSGVIGQATSLEISLKPDDPVPPHGVHAVAASTSVGFNHPAHDLYHCEQVRFSQPQEWQLEKIDGMKPPSPSSAPPIKAIEPTRAPAPTAGLAQPTKPPEAPKPTEVAKTTKTLEPVQLTLWTGEDGQALEWNQALVNEFHAANPHITINLVKRNEEFVGMAEDFRAVKLAGGHTPDMLWTFNVGLFAGTDMIQPVDALFDLSGFVDPALAAVKLNGKTWGVPISNGSHLMLLYNKKLIAQPPKDTDELFVKGKMLTHDGNYGLVWNQVEPFWLVPWLGGFKGKVFADDGVTPTLNTPEMIATLKFLHDMKFDAKIIPPESDYDYAADLFMEGKAAMIIDGDWWLARYKEKLGADLGVARMPMVKTTGEWPHPYTMSIVIMLAKEATGDKLEAAKAVIQFVTSKEKQLEMVQKLRRLPALKETLDGPFITGDPILKSSADQMLVGVPMPTVAQMRCNWDAMRSEMQAVLADKKTPEDAAKAMQSAADGCVMTLK